jgi:hypothetical protein
MMVFTVSTFLILNYDPLNQKRESESGEVMRR